VECCCGFAIDARVRCAASRITDTSSRCVIMRRLGIVEGVHMLRLTENFGRATFKETLRNIYDGSADCGYVFLTTTGFMGGSRVRRALAIVSL
jgi:hypothetical protein